ncbi:peptidoglycan -binding protein [Roseomonas sp. BN140053]|uniref:peptidoglycan -binding protein n=1 Tax=Roseomonas sp. BN140053 TaxID=3391898 RepID=UPI0039EA957D
MALSRRRRGGGEGLNAWPGYVDALSTLLMVIIFVLLVFVLAQGFLSVALSSRDRALDRLNRQVAELAELLSLERGQVEELRGGLGRAQEEARQAAAAREIALRELSGLRDERDRLGTERDGLRGERDRLAARLSDTELTGRGTGERIASLETRLAEALTRAEAAGGETAQAVRERTGTARALATEQAARQTAERALAAEQTARRQTAESLTAEQAARQQAERALVTEQAARRQTAESLTAEQTARRQAEASLATTRAQAEQAARDLAALRAEAERLNTQVRTDARTIEARLADLARLSEQVQALTALRDRLERQAQEALARAGDEERRRGAAEALVAEANRQAGTAAEARRAAEAQAGEYGRLAESARAQAALLAQQLEALRAELRRVAGALDAQESAGRDKDAQIAALGTRLNAALAARVEELQRYRSDFFGRVREVLGDRPDVRVVGDRFVFQSEVLFPVGSAELSERGQAQIRQIAGVLKEISGRIPEGVNWLLRVDGHADRTPLRGGGRFASNWELSSARAIAVAQLMINEGLPANRVAAAAFGENQPLDDRDTPEALARNRRIELRLTDR